MKIALLACFVIVATSCTARLDRSGLGDEAIWFKGNTHTHTVLCGHADASPEFVAKWYHDRGYNFLVLSEHNRFIDPGTVRLPANNRKDFILIAGQEISKAQDIHTTAMNTRSLADWDFDHADKSKIVQFQVDSTRAAGGEAILNHPNYRRALSDVDVVPSRHLRMFELFNGHDDGIGSYGGDGWQSTEQLWDKLLTAGMVIYGVSSDDAHIFDQVGPGFANPGRGWVMVRASVLTPDAITEAMKAGHFYASNGVYLRQYSPHPGQYTVVVDRRRTDEELTSLILHGKPVQAGEPGYRIEFIGPGGTVLHSAAGESGSYAWDGRVSYVRVRVTYTRQRANGSMEEFYAWGQPVFPGAAN